MSVQYYEGVGRRKAATARVRIMEGKGLFMVNDRPVEDFFPRLGDQESILAVLEAANKEQSKVDITVKVNGGGVTGQTGAVLLGLTRALIKMDENVGPALRKQGFMTRDPRVKERKKPGLKRARKAPTYTKR